MSQQRPLKWSDFDRYLKAEHLGGKSHVLTIKAVEVEELHPRPGVTTLAPVLYFVETKKGLALSPTNQDALQQLFGDDVAAAIGKRITVKAIALKVAGRDTQPIRISATPAANGQAPAPSQPATTRKAPDRMQAEAIDEDLIAADQEPK